VPMQFNTSSRMFETGPLSLWLSTQPMFAAAPAAGWATWQQLMMTARHPWCVAMAVRRKLSSYGKSGVLLQLVSCKLCHTAPASAYLCTQGVPQHVQYVRGSAKHVIQLARYMRALLFLPLFLQGCVLGVQGCS
jgi:hypothetical protein